MGKGLILFLSFVLVSCTITGDNQMLKNSGTLSIAQLLQTSVIQINDTWSNQEIQDLVNDYISNGYEVYDVYAHHGGTPANAFSSVSSATLDYVLCVWTGAANSTYNLNTTYFTGKTVVILDATINNTTNVVVTDYNSLTVDFAFANQTAFSNLKFELWHDISFSGGGDNMVESVELFNCDVSAIECKYLQLGILPFNGIKNWIINNCKLTIDAIYIKYTTELTMSNVHLYCDVNTYGCTLDANGINFTFINCVFYLKSADTTSPSMYISLGNVDFENCCFIGVVSKGSVLFITTKINSQQIIAYNANVINNISYDIRTVTITPVVNDWKYYYQTYKLNNALLPPTYTTFYNISCNVGVEYVIDDTVYGSLMKEYLTISFNPNNKIDDDVKNFHPKYINIANLTQETADLVTSQKYVKNYLLYSDSGATTPYTYTNNQNFILRIYNGTTLETHYVLWKENEIQKSIFSNPETGIVYTIQACFLLMQVKDIQGLKNIFPSTDSPLEGTIRFNLLDNEIVSK